jgi:F-type H+-transporting ATPase subunit delta
MSMTTQQSKRGAKRVFRWCLIDGRLDERRARLAVQRIVKPSRRGYLALLAHFHRLVKLEQVKYTARIESARVLPVLLKTSVQRQLESTYGQGITTSFTQNPGLIGGMHIQIGNDVYDGSVLSRLAALEKSFGITAEWKQAREI